MKTLDSNAAANRLTNLDPQLQRYVAAALPLMQLQTLPADKRAKLLADFNPDKHLTVELRAAMQQAKVDLKSPKPILEQVNLKSWFSCVDAALIQKAAASRSFDEAGGAGMSAQ